MAEPETRPPEPSRRRRSGVGGWRGAVIRWLDPQAAAGPPPAAPPPAAAETDAPVEASAPEFDLVDQAEAFASLRVSDVMTPRADIVALELSTPLDEVVRRFIEVELTRMPIYRETLDDPVGVIHIKDVVKLLAPAPGSGSGSAPGAQPPWSETVLDRMKRELLYVPASMRTADLLVRMRAQRIHMAMVIDEFGGSDGLVTLEDLIEAVVGDIDDEHDVALEPELVIRPDGLVEADGRTPLEALASVLQTALAPEAGEEEIDTVGGLLSSLAGRVPQRGELIEHPAGWAFEVLDADPRRVRRVRVRPSAARAASADAATPPDDEAA